MMACYAVPYDGYDGFPSPRSALQLPQDAAPLVDPAAASGAFHELTARLLIEHERVLAHNGELRAELARLRADRVQEELTELDLSIRVASPPRAVKLASEGHEVLADNGELRAELARLRAGPWGDPMEEELAEFGVSSPGDSSRAMKLQASEGHEIAATKTNAEEEESNTELSPPRCLSPRDNSKAARRISLASMSSGVSAAARRLSSNGRPLTKATVLAYRFLEDADSGPMARRYKACMQMLLFISVGTPLMQMLDRPLFPSLTGAVVEAFFDVVFTIELLARFVVTPAPRIFFRNGFNMIDLVTPATLTVRAIIGFVVPAEGTGSSAGITLLCLTPILRLLKMLRRWETIHLLTKAFVDVLEALPVLLFPLLMLTLTFAALIYTVEPRSNVPSLPTALWLTIVTMTTVGFGDVTPASTPGSLIVSLLVISSVMYMAMPVAILGSSFTKVWQERDSVMLLHRTRERLAQWGYTVNDIPCLFEAFTGGDTGELSIPEFARMIKAMKLGLTDERIMELFGHFDSNRSGTIDDREFVRLLYPSKYVEVYGTVVPGELQSQQSPPSPFGRRRAELF